MFPFWYYNFFIQVITSVFYRSFETSMYLCLTLTYVWVSGVPGPAVDGHHDPLVCQSGGLARFNTDARHAAVGWREEVPCGLNTGDQRTGQ